MQSTEMNDSAESEIISGTRFAFGENWLRYIENLSEEQIDLACSSLKKLLGVETLINKRFLDIGSGSGLFSLAAYKLGATVVSVDFDPQSVECTKQLRDALKISDNEWSVRQGSILDRPFVRSLGKFDISYSWGVLHHTGAMWKALENFAYSVVPQGTLVVSIYNDQGKESLDWIKIKKLYNRGSSVTKAALLFYSLIRIWGGTFLRDFRNSGNALKSWRAYKSNRGMEPWRDLVDWVGGYPFEVASPIEIKSFYKEKGFSLISETNVGKNSGCNEFVFLCESPS